MTQLYEPRPLRHLQIAKPMQNSQILADPREVHFSPFYLVLNGHFGVACVGEYFGRLRGILIGPPARPF